MRVMGLLKADKHSETGVPPSPELMERCAKFMEEVTKAGVLAASDGLTPSSQGKRVRVGQGKISVIDGPFAETKEVIASYAMLDVKSMAEAIEWTTRFLDMLGGGECELRPLYEAHDFQGACASQRPGEATSTKIFVNLPVKDLNKSVAFFTRLGYKFNPQFTDDTATCMIVSDDIFVMLLTEAKFKTFTSKAICDATKSTEVLVCLSCESRDAVNELVRKAVAAGGTAYAESKDHGFMYQHGYQDLDGHIWELVWMDPKAVH